MMNASPAPQEIFLLKLGEVVLKGLNRRSPLRTSCWRNVRRRVKNCGSFQCSLRQSTIYVEPAERGLRYGRPPGTPAARCSALSPWPGPCPVKRQWTPLWRPPGPIWRTPLPLRRASRWRASGRTRCFPMNSIQLSQCCGRRSGARPFPHVAVDVHTPGSDGICGDPGEVRLRPRSLRARRGRPAHRHGRPGGEPALRRHRLPGVLLDDRPAGAWSWRWSTLSPRPTPPSRPRTRYWSWPGC